MTTNPPTTTQNPLFGEQPGMVDSSNESMAMIAVFAMSGLAVCFASMSIACIYKLWSRFRSIQSTDQPVQLPPPAIIIETEQPELMSDIEEGELCYICTERRASTILMNCSHRGLCFQCTKTLIREKKSCPLCRAELVGMIHLMQSNDTREMV